MCVWLSATPPNDEAILAADWDKIVKDCTPMLHLVHWCFI